MAQSKAAEAGNTELQGSERERIIRKIKACLARAGSSNENEAQMAMRQAQAMMRNYKLSELDVLAQDVGTTTKKTGLSRMALWQRSLAVAAADAFGCKAIQSTAPWGEISFVFIGVNPASELAAYAYDSLLQQIKAARKAYQRKTLASRKRADDFCIAWVSAVSRKIEEFAGQNPVNAHEANALVLVETRQQAAVKDWMDKQFGEIKQHQQKMHEPDLAPMLAGIREGRKAQINQALNAGAGQQLMLEGA